MGGDGQPRFEIGSSDDPKLHQPQGTIQSFINRKDARYGVSGQMMLQINVSVALAEDIGILRFVAERADFIGTGLSIFMVSYPTVETVACLRDSVETFDRQMDSAQTLTLEESNKLRNNQKFTLPTSYLAVKQVCRAYHRLLAITLGFHHPITAAYEPFIRHFEDRKVELIEYLGRDIRKWPASCATFRLQFTTASTQCKTTG
jgi:hypothetical protein